MTTTDTTSDLLYMPTRAAAGGASAETDRERRPAVATVDLLAFRWGRDARGRPVRLPVRLYRFPGGLDAAFVEREARQLLAEEFGVADWRLVADGLEQH